MYWIPDCWIIDQQFQGLATDQANRQNPFQLIAFEQNHREVQTELSLGLGLTLFQLHVRSGWILQFSPLSTLWSSSG